LRWADRCGRSREAHQRRVRFFAGVATERFKGTTQEFVFDRSFRPGGTLAVLPMLIATGNVHQPRSPSPSRFVRSSRSSRWRHRPLRLRASRGFSGAPANQSIDRESLENCHSQKRCSRPLVRTSMRRHARKTTRARHDQARPLRPWRRPVHALSGRAWGPGLPALRRVAADNSRSFLRVPIARTPNRKGQA
jgi:hypothetical protein